MKQAFRQHLLQVDGDDELKRWFDPLEFDYSEENKRVTVSFPHAFFAQWFEKEIQNKFEGQLNQFLGSGYVVRYKTNGAARVGQAVQSQAAKRIDYPFGPESTFETFLINKKNYFPIASAREVAKQVGAMFNPFIICGPGGSGKTHILRAVANEISKNHDYSKMLITTVDDLNALYQMRFGGDVFKARGFVCGFDVFFLDDVHKIQEYPSFQNELINIFNHFYDNKKQMVFCLRDKLNTYSHLDSNLLSRLGWGLIVTLKEPDLEIRVGFIQHQARLKKLNLNKEQILTLARRFPDFRYLQGILLKLFAFKELVRADLSGRDFEHILNNTEEKTTDELTPRRIMAVVSDHFNVHIKELTGTKRHQNIAQARQVAMFLCRSLLNVSYPALGKVFGGKDHSTVLYSVKKIEQIQLDNEGMKQVLKTLKQKCRLP